MTKMSPVAHALLNAMYEIKSEKDLMREMEGAWSMGYIEGLNTAQRAIIRHLEYQLKELEEMERKIEMIAYYENEKALDIALEKVKTPQEAEKIIRDLEQRMAPRSWIDKAFKVFYKMI